MSKYSAQWMRDTREQVAVDLWRAGTAIGVIAAEIQSEKVEFNVNIKSLEAVMNKMTDILKQVYLMRRNFPEL